MQQLQALWVDNYYNQYYNCHQGPTQSVHSLLSHINQIVENIPKVLLESQQIHHLKAVLHKDLQLKLED